MYCTPSKRALEADPEDPATERQSTTTDGLSRQVSQYFQLSGSQMAPSPFVTRSILGSVVGVDSSELKSLRIQKIKLEHRLKHATIELERQALEAGELRKKLELLSVGYEKAAKGLQAERDFLFASAQASKEALVESQSALAAVQKQLQTAEAKQQKAAEDMSEERELLRQEQAMLARLKQTASDTLKSTETRLMARISALEAELALKSTQATELQRAVESLNADLDESKIRILTASKADLAQEDLQVVQRTTFEKVAELSSLQKSLRRLTAENESFRANSRSAVILEEELRVLRMQAKQKDVLETRVAELEARLKLQQTAATSTPSDSGAVRELLQRTVDVSRLTDEVSELKGRLAARDLELADAQHGLSALKAAQRVDEDRRHQLEREVVTQNERLKLARLEITNLGEQIMSHKTGQ